MQLLLVSLHLKLNDIHALFTGVTVMISSKPLTTTSNGFSLTDPFFQRLIHKEDEKRVCVHSK